MIEVEIMTTEEEVNVDIPHEEPEIKAAIDFSGEALRIGGNGLSAYEIALKNGFEGTEEEWLESLKGEDGKDGAPGANGKDGADGKDGKDGVDGAKGADGKDGISITHYWNGTTLVVESASGTSAVNLKGDTGAAGANGKDGTNGKNGANGKDGADGKTPVKGTDYFTEADKAEMVSAVIASLPVYNGEVVSV